MSVTTPPTPTGIDFLRSTTSVRTDREADGDTDVYATHLARFAVKPGTVADLKSQVGRQAMFQPQWLEIEWVNGRLAEVRITGPSWRKDKTLGATGRRRWWPHGRDGFGVEKVLADLPQPVRDALSAYELAVHVTEVPA